MNRADLQKMLEYGRQCLELARQTQDLGQLMVAHLTIGVARFFLGDFAEAKAHLEQICDRYHDPIKHKSLGLIYGLDPGVTGYAYLGHTLWFLGYPDQALNKVKKAHTFAEQLAHPYTLAGTHFYLAALHTYRQEASETETCSQTLIELSSKYEFGYLLINGQLMWNWARALQKQDEGQMIDNMKERVKAYLAMGSEVAYPTSLNLLAQMCIGAGRPDEAPAILSEAQAYAEKNGDRYNLAETYRLQGEALLPADQEGAEEAFLQGIAVSEQQEAKTLQLRCTTSLCRLWGQQGKESEARQLLSEIYDWFEEGFDTPDLQNAKALLKEMQ
jgi:predicted ATPase